MIVWLGKSKGVRCNQAKDTMRLRSAGERSDEDELSEEYQWMESF
jgi:hypothetical protein